MDQLPLPFPEPVCIGGRWFVYDEDSHSMVETDDKGVPLSSEKVLEELAAEAQKYGLGY